MSDLSGATATRRFTVTDADTAVSVGSGDVPVLGTPRMIAWCEAVTVEAIAPRLEEGRTTVGHQIRVDHLAPTPVGAEVEVTATVTEEEGRSAVFTVVVTHPGGEAATGTISRVVVDRQRFLERVGAADG